MAGKNKGSSDDGVVTSAPASSVGSLLTDLLNEAKKEVAEERVSLERQIQEKESEEREEKERDEARKREAMQRQLIEETRRRNEALTRKEREEQRKREALRPKVKERSAVSKIAPIPPPKKLPVVAIAAAAVVLVGLATTAAIAMSGDPEPIKLPDIRAQSTDVVSTARLQWENRMLRIKKEAAELRAKKAEGAALSEREKRIMAEDGARQAREDARKRAAEAEAAAVLNKKNGRRPGKRPGKGPKIDTSVFGGK